MKCRYCKRKARHYYTEFFDWGYRLCYYCDNCKIWDLYRDVVKKKRTK